MMVANSERIKKTMKKSGLFALLAAGALLVAGCGSSAKTIDAAALAKDLTTEITYEDTLEEVDADTVSMYIDLPEGVESEMYMGSGATAEEVGVFTAPDENTARETLDSVQSHLDDQTDSFSNYKPEEAKRVGSAVLEQKGNYVILCVSGDSDTAKDIIEEAFK
jgi:outer membrane murein-binding lipoprotein Lpp